MNTDIFNGSSTKQALKKSIDILDARIDSMRSLSNDPRISLKVKTVIENLKWEREKLLEKYNSQS